jgi:hypothetical protein
VSDTNLRPLITEASKSNCGKTGSGLLVIESFRVLFEKPRVMETVKMLPVFTEKEVSSSYSQQKATATGRTRI